MSILEQSFLIKRKGIDRVLWYLINHQRKAQYSYKLAKGQHHQVSKTLNQQIECTKLGQKKVLRGMMK